MTQSESMPVKRRGGGGAVSPHPWLGAIPGRRGHLSPQVLTLPASGAVARPDAPFSRGHPLPGLPLLFCPHVCRVLAVGMSQCPRPRVSASRAGPPGVLVCPGHWLLVLTKSLLYRLGDSVRGGQSSLQPFPPSPKSPRPGAMGWETEAGEDSPGHRSHPSPSRLACLLGDPGSRPAILPSLLSPLLCSPSSCRESQLHLQATAWLLRYPQAAPLTPPCPPFWGPIGPARPLSDLELLGPWQ